MVVILQTERGRALTLLRRQWLVFANSRFERVSCNTTSASSDTSFKGR